MFSRFHVDAGIVKESSAVDSIMADFILSFTRVGCDHLVALHDASNGKIGTAKPLDKGSLMFLLNEVCSDAPVESWRDPRILYQSSSVLAWYRKASVKPEKVWFRLGDKNLMVSVKLPTLVFVEFGNGLYVFAACTNNVTRNTQLYHAPLCNINGSGSLCFGRVDRPDSKDSLSVRMQKLEAALLETNFSHISCQSTFRALSDKKHDTKDHIAAWKQFEASGLMPKSKDMVKFGYTVEQVISQMERRS